MISKIVWLKAMINKTMFSLQPFVDTYFEEIIGHMKKIDGRYLNLFAQELLSCCERDGRIFIFGNGGSAANASHFCGDLVASFSSSEKRFLAQCLSDNVPAMMAIANDVSYEDVFYLQLRDILKPQDLCIAVSGSGKSKNVVKALQYAKEIGCRSVGMCGFDGGVVKNIVDVAVHVDVYDMEMTEDIHLMVFHCMKRVLHCVRSVDITEKTA